MNKVILEQASKELQDAVAYYEEEQPGLDLRLKGETDEHVKWIINNPNVPRIRKGGFRRVNLKVFP